MKRKVLSIFLAFVLTAGLLPYAVLAADDADTPTISIGSKSAEAGDTVSLAVKLSGNSDGIAAVNFSCSFDKSVITCIDTAEGSAFKNCEANPDEYPVKVVAYSTKNVTEAGTIVTLTFAIDENCPAGTYPLTLSFLSASRVPDSGSGTEPVSNITMKSGSITVTEAEEPEVTLTGLSITTNPTKTEYVEGEEFDPTGMVVTATYSDGSTKTVTDYDYSPKTLTVDTKEVTVSYESKTATVKVKVTAAEEPEVTLTDLKITTNPTKTEYVEGEEFDPTGMVVTATYSDGSTKTVTDYDYSPKTLTADTKEVTVSYEGKTATVSVTVTAVTVTGLTIAAQPTKTQYVEGQDFDPAGMVVNATYSDGNTKPVTDYTYSPKTLTLDTKSVTVSYGGQTATVPVTVVKKALDSISLNTTNAKTAFTLGDTFSADGIVVTAKYNDGTTKGVTDYIVSEPDMSKTGKPTVTVSYTEDGITVSATYTITVTQANIYTISISAGANGEIIGASTVVEGEDVTFLIVPHDGYQISNVRVDGKSVGAVSLYTFEDVKENHTIAATFQKVQSAFTDVSAGTYYYDAVLWAVENGITQGTSTTKFSPDATCTRAQVVTFLWRAAGEPAPTSSVNPFTDVKSGDYYYNAVLWAVENGITQGTSATTFSPDATCTRAQVVTFLWRAENSPAVGGGNTFTDVPADAYYAAAVKWAVKNGITEGTSDTTFSPDRGCTRAQVVTFLYRNYAD